MGLPEDITRLEVGLRELIIKYEQYFMGIEKREPLQLVEELERCARQYQGTAITNTMLKFKYQSLVSSFYVHKQKWTRITRLIEEGKYHRTRFKTGSADSPTAPAPVISGTVDTELERIFQEYIAARRACNLPTDNISRDKIAAAIEKQRPMIAQKYRCQAIEFNVVVEGGTPRIKARPKIS